MPKINIRIAKKSDLDIITSYYHKLYKGDEEQTFYNSEIAPQNFKSGNSLLIAEINSKVVGYLWFVWYEHIKYKGVAYFEELYVTDKYRKITVGKTLINEAKIMLNKLGITTIYVAVGRHMTDAQHFYNRIGFKKSGEVWFRENI